MEGYTIVRDATGVTVVKDKSYWKEVQQKKYDILLRRSEIPKFYWNISFEDYKGTLSTDSVDKCVTYSKKCFTDKFDYVNLYLWSEENSSQKCIIGNSMVLAENGFSYIKDFSNNSFGFSKKHLNILTKDGLKSSSHFFEEETKKTFLIKTNLGLEIEGTPEHPILVFDKNCNILFKKLKDISNFDYVISRKNTQIFSKENRDFEFTSTFSNSGFRAKSINLPNKMTKNLSRFLGYYVANGYIDKNSIKISTKNIDIQNDIIDILKDFDLSIGKIDCEKDFCIHSVTFVKFIKHIFNIGEDKKFTARYKYISDYILQGTKEIQIEFLKGLIDCDSYLSKNKRLGYFTASKQLAFEVQLLLLNLGIVSSMRSCFLKQYDHIYFELWMSVDDTNSYFKLFGKSLKYNFIEIIKNQKTNSYFVNIPYLLSMIQKEFLRLKEVLNVNRKGIYVYEGDRCIFPFNSVITYPATDLSRNYFNKILNLIENFKHKNLFDDIFLQKINDIREDFLFLKIKTINILNEKKIVYDFTIPEYHNFYSNGLVSHNTAVMCNIGKEAILHGKKVKFVLAGTLIDRLIKNQGFSYNEEIEYYLKNLKNQDILLIDDIFDSKKSIHWNNSDLIVAEIDRFFRELCASGIKIVMTSNVSINQIGKKYGSSINALIERNFYSLEFRDSIKEHRKKMFENIFDED